MTEEHTERLSTSISEERKQQIRLEAAKRGMTMSQLVREILEEEFSDIDPDGGDEGKLTTAATA